MLAFPGLPLRAVAALTAILCATGLICMILLMSPTWLLWPLLTKDRRSDLLRLVTAWTTWVAAVINSCPQPEATLPMPRGRQKPVRRSSEALK